MSVEGTEQFAQAIAGTPPQAAPVEQNDAASPQDSGRPAVFVFNGKTFGSQEEMLSYASTRDMQASSYETMSASRGQQEQVKESKYSDTIFTDPDATLGKVEENIERKIEQKIAAREAARVAEQTFYEKYGDLAEHKDLVQFYAGKLMPVVANLPVEQQYLKLATEVRSKISKIRGAEGTVTELKSGPANVLGSGSGKPTSTSTTSAPKSFSEQIKAMQNKHKK